MDSVSVKAILRDPQAHFNQKVTVSGWVRTLRDSKNFGFIELNDGTYFKNLQVVFEEGKLKNFKDVTRFTIGSSLTVVGTLVESPGAKQPIELHADSIELVGLADRGSHRPNELSG
ncbi:MAG TPA: OB-fold nucleic acid binding domain-containing protein, partial [Calditrichia bacterium]|nr:OB-fold nucleic acid binding domain-containing protein [Calditrichia bacterium]